MKNEEENIIFSKSKGRKVGVWEAISYFGKTSLYLYEENFDADIYINFLKEAMLEMKEFSGEENVVMQMDNARYHWTNQVLQFYQKNNIKVIDWPPYSPDLNPIENLWSIMKDKLKGKKFISMRSLKSKLIKLWENIDEDLVKRLCESIYNRIDTWMETKGGLINY